MGLTFRGFLASGDFGGRDAFANSLTAAADPDVRRVTWDALDLRCVRVTIRGLSSRMMPPATRDAVCKGVGDVEPAVPRPIDGASPPLPSSLGHLDIGTERDIHGWRHAAMRVVQPLREKISCIQASVSRLRCRRGPTPITSYVPPATLRHGFGTGRPADPLIWQVSESSLRSIQARLKDSAASATPVSQAASDTQPHHLLHSPSHPHHGWRRPPVSATMWHNSKTRLPDTNLITVPFEVPSRFDVAFPYHAPPGCPRHGAFSMTEKATR